MQKFLSKTFLVSIWQKKIRCRRDCNVIVQEISTCQQEGIAAVAPTIVATAQRSGSRWMSWTRSLPMLRLAKTDSSSVLIEGLPMSQAQSKKQSLSICQKMGISSFTEVRYRKDHFPSDSRNGSSSQAEPRRKSDHVPAGFRNQWSSALTQSPHVADSLLLDRTEENPEIHPDHQPRVGSYVELLRAWGQNHRLYREVTGKQEPAWSSSWII